MQKSRSKRGFSAEERREDDQKELPIMPISAVSSGRLHCCLLVLILFILILLTLPLLLIYVANTRFEERENSRPASKTTVYQSCGAPIEEVHCIQRPAAGSGSRLAAGFNETSQLASNGTTKSSGYNAIEHSNNNNNSKPTINYCNEANLQTNQSPSNEYLQCPVGLFGCKTNPEICIEQKRNCDGTVDCPNKSDEDGCHDSSGAMEKMYSFMIKTAIMTDLPRSTDGKTDPGKLDVEMSLEEELSFRERFLVPKNCTIKDFKRNVCECNLDDTIVVICAKASLTGIPRNLRPSVKKIKLDYNSIDSIDGVQWPEPLTNLVLIYNNLTHLSAKAFESAPNLSQLYLSHNEISAIDDQAFDGLTSLTRLSMESNKLKSFNMRILLGTTKIRIIHLSENMIDLPDDTRFGLFPHLKEINLDHNKITVIRSHWFSNSPALEWISLVSNEISTIEPGSFDGSNELLQLDLPFNKIKVINRQMFARNLNMKRLDLAGNKLKFLPEDAFDEIIHLESLNLTYIDFDYLQRDTFSKLRKLDFIYFAKFRYCHYANNVRVCLPSTDGLSSMKELLAFSTLKYAVWIVAFVCSVGNVLVFLWRSISPHEDKTLSLFVKNLSIADLMMGIYLCAIGWKDVKFQDNFGCHAIEWMSSYTCTAIGFLAILSSELSVFILLIITIERYRCIISIAKFQEEAQKRRARIYVALAWICSLLIAFYPLVERIWSNSDYFATNGLCLPLHIDQPFTAGWQYSAFIYLGINFSAVLVIITLYTQMYSMIIDSRQTSRPVLLRSEKREDAILAIRLFFIVVTDCLCWIPIVVIKLMALANVSISASIYGWLVVFIIPINSALNPILYTLAAPTSLRDAVFRQFERLCYKIDQITAGSARSSNYSSQSSSTATSANSAQQPIIGNGRRRSKAMGSISTNTCDTFETSIVSCSKGSVGSAILNPQHSSLVQERETYLHQSLAGNVPRLSTSHATIAVHDELDEFKSEINGKFYHNDLYHQAHLNLNRTAAAATTATAKAANELGEIMKVHEIEGKTQVQLQQSLDCFMMGAQQVAPNQLGLRQLVATLPYSDKGNIQSMIVYDFHGKRCNLGATAERHIGDDGLFQAAKSIVIRGGNDEQDDGYLIQTKPSKQMIIDSCRCRETAACDVELGLDEDLALHGARQSPADCNESHRPDRGTNKTRDLRVNNCSNQIGRKKGVAFSSIGSETY